MTDDHDALRKVDFPCSHSYILKSAESRMRTAPQRCDNNDSSQREAKPGHTNEDTMLKATVWGIRCSECVLSVKLGCHCHVCQLRVTPGHITRGSLSSNAMARRTKVSSATKSEITQNTAWVAPQDTHLRLKFLQIKKII